MTKITSFGRREHSEVSAKVQAALKTLGDELGVKFTTTGGQYGTGSGMIRLSVEVQDTGAGVSAAEAEFKRYAAHYGMQPDWFGKTFFHQGTQYRITGINPGAPKFPVNAERTHDGKSFKMTRYMVVSEMEQTMRGRAAA
jgi:hypothetical protein